MARLDVYLMPGKDREGYVLDVQAELLTPLSTRAVVPLLPQSRAPAPMHELNPVFEIAGQPHVMVTQAIAAISVRELKNAVLSLAVQRDKITRALDILLVGF
jgi:toxin CcdB